MSSVEEELKELFKNYRSSSTTLIKVGTRGSLKLYKSLYVDTDDVKKDCREILKTSKLSVTNDSETTHFIYGVLGANKAHNINRVATMIALKEEAIRGTVVIELSSRVSEWEARKFVKRLILIRRAIAQIRAVSESEADELEED